MSFLDKLLEGVEVEWKTLGEVAEIIRGVRVTKKDLLSDGNILLFQVEQDIWVMLMNTIVIKIQ